MQAHRVKTVLSEDGVIVLRGIPFRRGDAVEVVVYQFPEIAQSASRYPLRGKPVALRSPAVPVAEAEWEATE